jgi:guanine deaminase
MCKSAVVVYYGPIINPIDLHRYQALPRCLLAVGSNGTIDWIVDDVEDSMVQEVLARNGLYVDSDSNVEMCVLKEGEFLMPGLIDTHTVSPYTSNRLTT